MSPITPTDQGDAMNTASETHQRQLELRYLLLPIEGVAHVALMPSGGGCEVLLVEYADRRVITASDSDAQIPTRGDAWTMIVLSPNIEAWEDWREDEIRELDTCDTDAALADCVRQHA